MDGRLLRSRKSDTLTSGGRAVQLLLAASLALNIYLLFFRGAAPEPAGEPDAPVADAGDAGAAASPSPEGEGPDGPEVPAVPMAATRYERLHLQVHGSIAQTFGEALGGEKGDLVSAFYSRIFMWPLDLKSDVRRDDELTLIYAIGEDGQVDIPAARYKSQKNRVTYRAYHFQQDGRRWPHYYDEGGVEVASRLTAGPLDDYEQVTSLLKDRPTHKGIDFKTPVGTPVKSPFRGTVSRINWSHRFNGNCVEIQYPDGSIAKFLHLDKLRSGIKPGATVAAGQALADSGNTGHSTAPHLHYQLEKGTRILDPFTVHETYHLTLGDADMTRFNALKERLDAQLDGKAEAVGAGAAEPE